MTDDFDFSDLKTATLKKLGKQPVVMIERSECVASVALKGGQILTFTPQGNRSVLWHNKYIDYDSEEPLRQGVPICWPWFGSLDKNPDHVKEQYITQYDDAKAIPSHGLVRGKEWELLRIEESSDATEVLLFTEIEQPKLRLLVNYRIGRDLTVELTTENKSSETVHFSCALHSYFSVSDIEDILIPDLNGIPYIDSLKRWEKHVQTGALRFNSEVDRGYYNTPNLIRIKDEGWHRSIRITSAESHSAVVWNPWTDKSQHLSQFSPEAYKTMVCVETAKIYRDTVRLDAGKSSKLSVTIDVENT